ncbi:RagB/SusD family nutrient uptake outer membrane protein [Puteibacter caeruleilacunae]|nr:RagB/SusD family nutrient uptake outer membrane protein [Puteibacter caeruleilacunae]
MRTLKMKYSLIILIVSSMFVACDSVVELTPKSGIETENYFKNEADVLVALNGVYDALGDLNGYGNKLWGAGIEIMNDEMEPTPGKSNIILKIQLSNGTVENENTILKDIWGNAYVGINAANLVLSKLPEVEMDERLKNRVEAECRFNRALWYFNLVRMWGDVPLKLQPSTTIDEVYDRAPKEDVYAQIIEDFEFGAGVVNGNWSESNSETGLMWSYEGQNERGRATKGAAMAYLAKVYQHKAGWPLKDAGAWAKSVAWSKRVIESGNYGVYGDLDNDGIYEDDNYSRIWGYDNEYNEEIIFDVQFIQGEVGEGGQIGSYYGVSGKAVYGASNTHGHVLTSFTDSYDSADNRFEWNVVTFKYTKANDGSTQPHKKKKDYTLGKFRRPWGADHYWTDIPLNLPLIRYSDILLTYAEGLFETGGDVQVINNAINEIRKRAYGTKWEESKAVDVTGMDHETFIDMLLQERSWELCYEGMRWFDLVRTEKLIEKINESVNDGKENFKWPLHGQLPIPQYELDINTHWATNGYDL